MIRPKDLMCNMATVAENGIVSKFAKRLELKCSHQKKKEAEEKEKEKQKEKRRRGTGRGRRRKIHEAMDMLINSMRESIHNIFIY